jgi:hypothetical protein
LFWSLSCFSSRRIFLLAREDWDDALTTGDGALIYMSMLAREEELLVEWNDTARLNLPKYLLIFLPARV